MEERTLQIRQEAGAIIKQVLDRLQIEILDMKRVRYRRKRTIINLLFGWVCVIGGTVAGAIYSPQWFDWGVASTAIFLWSLVYMMVMLAFEHPLFLQRYRVHLRFSGNQLHIPGHALPLDEVQEAPLQEEADGHHLRVRDHERTYAILTLEDAEVGGALSALILAYAERRRDALRRDGEDLTKARKPPQSIQDLRMR